MTFLTSSDFPQVTVNVPVLRTWRKKGGTRCLLLVCTYQGDGDYFPYLGNLVFQIVMEMCEEGYYY